MVYLVAHRGMGENFEKIPGRPMENTLDAFSKAIGFDADVIQFDCQRTKDERVAIIHDETLDKTTNGTGLVSESTYEYMSTLRIGKDYKIPALEHALNCIDGKAVCNLHLSGKGIAEPVAKILKEYIGNKWNLNDFLVSSSDFKTLQKVRELMPDIRLGLAVDNSKQEPKWAEKCAQIKAFSLHINIQHINAEIVEQIHSKGLKVFVGNARSITEIRQMKSLLNEKDYICSDCPEVFGLCKWSLSL